jgi:hypothetical protein
VIKKRLLATAVVGALAFGAAGTVAAAVGPISNSAGARAWSDSNYFVYAQDTWCDGFSVNADYILINQDHRTLNNAGGCGTTRSTRSYTLTYAIRACTVRPIVPDICSAWAV